MPDPTPSTPEAPPPGTLPGTLPDALPGAPLPGRGQPLGAQLAAHFAERIRHRTLTPGARLPSVRDCARQHRVSPSTVVLAYDQLQAQGLVEARRQRGFFVRGPVAAARTAAPAGALIPPDGLPGGATLEAPVDATALIRGMFQRSGSQAVTPTQAAATATLPRLIGPGPGQGTLPEAWLDAALLTRALRRALPDAQEALRYGEPAGDAGLRQALSRRLVGDLGLAAAPGQIVTTTGATHALDLVARTLLRPGDAVLVDEPGWAVEFARLSRLGMRLLPVPRCKDGHDGPDLAVMARLLAEHRPRLYVTVSVLHNPTGHTLSLAAAHQILKLADAHDLTIVEDDTYAWLAPAHAPRLSALDGLQRTVYVSGFSKILAPNWRVGYVAAAPALAERLIDTKLLTTLTTPSLMERAVAWCLDQGLLRRHAERVQLQLEGARQRVVRLAEAAGCRFVTAPHGLFGWVDTGVDTDALAARMADAGWLLAPGSLFHAVPCSSPLMRVNFASAQDLRFWRAFENARALLLNQQPP
ncbi:aminotransferase-like domain-containing protein [Aquabacterium sp. OR-4]|uniref:aminotransferase-like domain-containing protein n=1 Tax=Aquabacterium sp. OR-4 TaxID=2978127 RepID=UPI0021B2F11E|nr:PLP-dependent aminotransferase family protein [Aquabacterium sp. OR-4]MDT7837786.1 PLP-dependent aminotransferase family protein [Aquabacterium sp. OR-4]